MRRFDMGKTLSTALSVWVRGLPSMLAISLAVLIPVTIVFGGILLVVGLPLWFLDAAPPEVQDPDATAGEPFWTLVPALVALVFGTIIHTQLTSGAIALGVFRLLRGEPIRIGECLSGAVRHILPLMGLVIIIFLATAVGLLVCGVGALLPIVVWFTAIPVVVVERTGVGKALKRSEELTRGSRWWILLLFIVLSLINGMIGAFASVAGLFNETANVIGQVVSTVIGPTLMAVGQTVSYHDLRRVKEGLGEEDLASIFA